MNPAKAAEQMVRIPEDMEIESLPGAPQSGPAITIIKFVREDRPNNGWYFL